MQWTVLPSQEFIFRHSLNCSSRSLIGQPRTFLHACPDVAGAVYATASLPTRANISDNSTALCQQHQDYHHPDLQTEKLLGHYDHLVNYVHRH